jgi:hypothetical protein
MESGEECQKRLAVEAQKAEDARLKAEEKKKPAAKKPAAKKSK